MKTHPKKLHPDERRLLNRHRYTIQSEEKKRESGPRHIGTVVLGLPEPPREDDPDFPEMNGNS